MSYKPNGKFYATSSEDLEKLFPKDAKTQILSVPYMEVSRDEYNRLLLNKGADGKLHKAYPLIPDIKDVAFYQDKKTGKTNTVSITFDDGTVTKATAEKDDIFDSEKGIIICLFKRFLDEYTDGAGTAALNKPYRRAERTFKYNLKRKTTDEANRQEVERRKVKAAAKAQARRERKAAELRELEIEIQKEAYLRAMREWSQEKK